MSLLTQADNTRTIVVFGGNGFVGRRICQQAIDKGYRVIAVSRSGCHPDYQSESWASKVEWYKADALKPESYSQYLSNQNPYAIFTMMGVFNAYKQLTSNVSTIIDYAGTSNVNVCKLGKNIKSLNKFVYIGGPNGDDMGVDKDNYNDYFHLWSKLMIGQALGKELVEKCIMENYGDDKWAVFRPTLIAGWEWKYLFGYKYKGNRVIGSDYEWIRSIYKWLDGDMIQVDDLAKDALDFMEGKQKGFECVNNSKDSDKWESDTITRRVMENMDSLVNVIALLILFCIGRCLLRRK